MSDSVIYMEKSVTSINVHYIRNHFKIDILYEYLFT